MIEGENAYLFVTNFFLKLVGFKFYYYNVCTSITGMTLISDLSLYAAEAEKKTLYVDLSNKQTSSSSTSSTAP